MAQIEQLPTECCHAVFSLLDLRDIMAVCSTCKALRHAAKVCGYPVQYKLALEAILEDTHSHHSL